MCPNLLLGDFPLLVILALVGGVWWEARFDGGQGITGKRAGVMEGDPLAISQSAHH